MKSILESVTSAPGNAKGASAIKENITTLLKETVAQIVVAHAESSLEAHDDDGGHDGVADLCAIVEALFLSGLKDGFMSRFRRTLDVDQPCTLSFWHLLLEVSHQENIKQVEKLSIIRTEVGQCRAWIRIVLNEALLSSYLKTIKENRKTLLRYYHGYAFLLDAECIDIAQILIEKVEAVTLKLPCNSGILNSWNDFPLSLAGIAYRPMRLNQIAPGVDIAQMLPTSSSRNSETCSIASSIISQSSGIGQMVSLSEDEALKMIIKNHSDKESSMEEAKPNTPQVHIEQIKSNNLSSIVKEQNSWSFDAIPGQVDNMDHSQSEAEVVDPSRLLERSYSSIVESNFLNGTHIRTPDFRDVLQRLGTTTEPKNDQVGEPVEEIQCDDVRTELEPPSIEAEVSLADLITRLGNEKGLDSQDYKCHACQKPIPIVNNQNSACAYTGNYYCDTCMAHEEIYIPARIVFNWDFKKYRVSQRAFNFLQEVKHDPLVDFKTANPYIYSVVDEMARLQILRNQLNYLRAYLYTCREPVIEQLQKMMYPTEYMYEHIHQYSISDLLEIKNGSLAAQLEKVVRFGIDHVTNCWLCSQKGFLCELCEDSKPLFPFDTDNVYRCHVCSGVSHKTCLNASKPCPRCDRKHKRELLPGAVEMAETND